MKLNNGRKLPSQIMCMPNANSAYMIMFTKRTKSKNEAIVSLTCNVNMLQSAFYCIISLLM